MNTKINMPPSTFGVWEVTTEGDCEGRTTRNLGIHEGFIDEIAFKLADQAEYKLQFKWLQPRSIAEKPAVATEVHISLSIDTGTWDTHGSERTEIFRSFLHGRDVEVQDGQFYASVKLLAGADDESRALHESQVKRAVALAKLTDQDKEVLGLK